MDRMLYLAGAAAREIMMRQASNNHNLANLSTPGFRADLDAAQAKPVYGPGLASRVYTQTNEAGVSMEPGTLIQTGQPLDVAVEGDGLIAVQAADGNEAYTRAGNLRVNAVGLLETAKGELVLGEGGPIAVPPFDKVEVGADGTISILPSGQQSTLLTPVDRLKLVKPAPAELEKRPDGLLAPKNGLPLPADASVSVTSGAFESSNVNSVEALVTMIELARRYESNIKLMAIASENDASSSRLLDVN